MFFLRGGTRNDSNENKGRCPLLSRVPVLLKTTFRQRGADDRFLSSALPRAETPKNLRPCTIRVCGEAALCHNKVPAASLAARIAADESFVRIGACGTYSSSSLSQVCWP